MAEIRISQASKTLGVSTSTIIDTLKNKGFEVDNNINAKISSEMYDFLCSQFDNKSENVAEKKPKLLSSKLKKKEEIENEVKVELETPVEIPVKEIETAKEIVVEIPEKQNPKNVEEVPVIEEKEILSDESPKLKIKGKIELPDNKKKSKKDKEEKVVSAKKSKKEEPVIVEEIVVIPAIEEIIEEPEIERELVKAKLVDLDGLTIKGKIELKAEPVIVRTPYERPEKPKRKRKSGPVKINIQQEIKDNRPRFKTEEPKKQITQKEVQDKLKTTLSKIDTSGRGKTSKSKFKKQKRDDHYHSRQEELVRQEKEDKILKVTEFLTANDLAKLMNVNVNEVISVCFSVGIMVSINQRLDAQTIELVSGEFGFEVSFVDAEETISIEEDIDDDSKMIPRPPIVTVMGHVDHGKTSLLDYIRKANVIAGEAGGITQHIGAYEVKLPNNQKITFLDTPGHEAFTAMRARGAKVTDVAVIVIAADDAIMPQTKEAIAHAQAADVPMVFAINKIDKDGANPEKIREQLASMNILVEEWGGTYQSQEISAKKGLNVDKLLEKILLQAEMLELKADPERKARGTVVEAKLDKGRGIVATILIQKGTLKVGDHLVAGANYAKVKALFNERNQRIDFAGPSCPAGLLGFSESPSAGDPLIVLNTEEEAKELANKRQQLLREQGIRTTKHITLDEIGRRLAVGNFKELNLIVKGDVNGSVEALSDSLLNLSNQEIMVNVIHKGVGQITESDVLLASASDAIIVGFQVRPSSGAKKLAENEQIDIRHYSIIYQAIDEIKSAIEGMLSPEIKETIIGNVEIREVFKITKVGTIAGCMVTDGKLTRNSKLRIIRDGVVVHSGEIDGLKRFKDDVKDVLKGFECGLSIKNYNDIQVGDNLEIFETVSIARKLE